MEKTRTVSRLFPELADDGHAVLVVILSQTARLNQTGICCVRISKFLPSVTSAIQVRSLPSPEFEVEPGIRASG